MTVNNLRLNMISARMHGSWCPFDKVAGPTSSFGGVDGSVERARRLCGPSSTGRCRDHCSISIWSVSQSRQALSCVLSTLPNGIVIEELERQSIRQNASFFSFSTTSFVRYCSQHPLPKGNAEDILMLSCTTKCQKSCTMPPSKQEIVLHSYTSCLRSNLGCYLFVVESQEMCISSSSCIWLSICTRSSWVGQTGRRIECRLLFVLNAWTSPSMVS